MSSAPLADYFILECNHDSGMDDSFSTLGLHSIFSEDDFRRVQQKKVEKAQRRSKTGGAPLENFEEEESLVDEEPSHSRRGRGDTTTKQEEVKPEESPKPLFHGNRWLESTGLSVSARNLAYDHNDTLGLSGSGGDGQRRKAPQRSVSAMDTSGNSAELRRKAVQRSSSAMDISGSSISLSQADDIDSSMPSMYSRGDRWHSGPKLMSQSCRNFTVDDRENAEETLKALSELNQRNAVNRRSMLGMGKPLSNRNLGNVEKSAPPPASRGLMMMKAQSMRNINSAGEPTSAPSRGMLPRSTSIRMGNNNGLSPTKPSRGMIKRSMTENHGSSSELGPASPRGAMQRSQTENVNASRGLMMMKAHSMRNLEGGDTQPSGPSRGMLTRSTSIRIGNGNIPQQPTTPSRPARGMMKRSMTENHGSSSSLGLGPASPGGMMKRAATENSNPMGGLMMMKAHSMRNLGIGAAQPSGPSRGMLKRSTSIRIGSGTVPQSPAPSKPSRGMMRRSMTENHGSAGVGPESPRGMMRRAATENSNPMGGLMMMKAHSMRNLGSGAQPSAPSRGMLKRSTSIRMGSGTVPQSPAPSKPSRGMMRRSMTENHGGGGEATNPSRGLSMMRSQSLRNMKELEDCPPLAAMPLSPNPSGKPGQSSIASPKPPARTNSNEDNKLAQPPIVCPMTPGAKRANERGFAALVSPRHPPARSNSFRQLDGERTPGGNRGLAALVSPMCPPRTFSSQQLLNQQPDLPFDSSETKTAPGMGRRKFSRSLSCNEFQKYEDGTPVEDENIPDRGLTRSMSGFLQQRVKNEKIVKALEPKPKKNRRGQLSASGRSKSARNVTSGSTSMRSVGKSRSSRNLTIVDDKNVVEDKPEATKKLEKDLSRLSAMMSANAKPLMSGALSVCLEESTVNEESTIGGGMDGSNQSGDSSKGGMDGSNQSGDSSIRSGGTRASMPSLRPMNGRPSTDLLGTSQAEQEEEEEDEMFAPLPKAPSKEKHAEAKETGEKSLSTSRRQSSRRRSATNVEGAEGKQSSLKAALHKKSKEPSSSKSRSKQSSSKSTSHNSESSSSLTPSSHKSSKHNSTSKSRSRHSESSSSLNPSSHRESKHAGRKSSKPSSLKVALDQSSHHDGKPIESASREKSRRRLSSSHKEPSSRRLHKEDRQRSSRNMMRKESQRDLNASESSRISKQRSSRNLTKRDSKRDLMSASMPAGLHDQGRRRASIGDKKKLAASAHGSSRRKSARGDEAASGSARVGGERVEKNSAYDLTTSQSTLSTQGTSSTSGSGTRKPPSTRRRRASTEPIVEESDSSRKRSESVTRKKRSSSKEGLRRTRSPRNEEDPRTGSPSCVANYTESPKPLRRSKAAEASKKKRKSLTAKLENSGSLRDRRHREDVERAREAARLGVNPRDLEFSSDHRPPSRHGSWSTTDFSSVVW